LHAQQAAGANHGNAGSGRATTLSLEDHLKLGVNHLDSLVDSEGRTYFNTFLTEPPEAVTDWPDFVDLPSRYWEASVLIQSSLGTTVESQERLARWLFPRIEQDGLAYRPNGPISNHVAELFDQSRLMYALVSRAMQEPGDDQARRRLANLADGLRRLSTRESNYAYIEKIGLYYGGTLIRPMLQAGIVLHRDDFIELAAAFSRAIVDHSDLIAADGTFIGHVHAALGTIAGISAVGAKTGDAHLLERGRAGFDYARGISTEFGFVPELSKRGDDIIGCETCAIMDYLDAALLLARHVDPAYYEVVEKTGRNHLWESMVRDGSWLGPEGGTDEDGIIRSDFHRRAVGSSAGWSAPHCALAYYEPLGEGWVKTPALRSRYLAKPRAQQNCCAGAGIRATYQVWSGIVTEEPQRVSVNLSLDRTTPGVEVTSFLPFEGRVRIAMKRDADLRWRRPGHCAPGDVRVKSSGPSTAAQADGPYLALGRQRSGTVLELTFPLPARHESLTIGNHGHQQYRFDVDWRGETVMGIRPDPANAVDARSDLAGKRVTAFYNRQGPGPLYQRQTWTEGLAVAPAATVSAATGVDWYTL
jgi:hypothetical protein